MKKTSFAYSALHINETTLHCLPILNNLLVKTRLNLYQKDICKIAEQGVNLAQSAKWVIQPKKLTFKEFHPTCNVPAKGLEFKIVKPREEANPRLTVQQLNIKPKLFTPLMKRKLKKEMLLVNISGEIVTPFPYEK